MNLIQMQGCSIEKNTKLWYAILKLPILVRSMMYGLLIYICTKRKHEKCSRTTPQSESGTSVKSQNIYLYI